MELALPRKPDRSDYTTAGGFWIIAASKFWNSGHENL